MMVPRLAIERIKTLAGLFPVVLILGPRQCGKTTLARHFLKGEYFDLEKPSDRQIFSGDIEFAVRQFETPLIFDEAQVLPELFPVLRALVDEERSRSGRFFMLGSVNPALVRQISESLAGRAGIIELTPFLFSEVAGRKISFNDFWLKGGYPDALMAENAINWRLWQENYLRTFIERDLQRFEVKASSFRFSHFVGMIAALHGGLLNLSELGRSLGASYHTVDTYLYLLEGHFLIRKLKPYHANIGKRLVKAPRVYLRDTGVLHSLLGIAESRDLLASPKRGASFEGLMIEQIVASEQLRTIGSRFFFYRSHAGAEIDLVIDRGQERIGFEFKCGVAAERRDWAGLKMGINEGIIDRGNLVYLGERSFGPEEGVTVVPAADICLKGLY